MGGGTGCMAKHTQSLHRAAENELFSALGLHSLPAVAHAVAPEMALWLYTKDSMPWS